MERPNPAHRPLPPGRIRIGVLGCAGIARRSVVPAIRALSDRFELVAVASRSQAKAGDFAHEFGCEAIEGYEALVSSAAIDALYVPLPTGLHAEWIERALRSGKHVYAEKSFASRPSEAQRMVASARSANLALMEGFMFQYHPQHRQVIGLLEGGAIGEVRHFAGAFGFPPLAPDNFRYDEEIGGGALLDAAAYPLRAAHFVLGDGLQVRAATLRIDPGSRTSIGGSAFLSDGNGLGASIAFGFDSYYQCRYEIWGSAGKLTAERAYTPRPDYRPRLLLETGGATQTILAEADDHFVRAFEEFHRIVVDASGREKHYRDILLQSVSLDAIRNLGRPGWTVLPGRDPT